MDKSNYIKPNGTLMSPEEAARKYFQMKKGLEDKEEEAKTETTTSLSSSAHHFHKRMKSGQSLVMIGIITIGIGVVVLTSLLSFVGLVIMGVGIYQYSVAQSKYHTALQREKKNRLKE